MYIYCVASNLAKTLYSRKLSAPNPSCSLPLWRVHEIKHIYLVSRTHGYNLNTILLLAWHTHNSMICTGLTLYWSTWHNPLDILLTIPLDNPPLPGRSLLLTWNPSFVCGATPVHSGPRLLVNWPSPSPSPSPPHFNYVPFYDDITTSTSYSLIHLYPFFYPSLYPYPIIPSILPLIPFL